MLRTIVEKREVNTLLGLLSRVLDVRVTFFDEEGRELELPGIKPMSPYCSMRRADAAVVGCCRRCDLDHIAEARRLKRGVVYVCHAGLVEGAAPLYDARGNYLGVTVFGQMRPPGARLRSAKASGRNGALVRAWGSLARGDLARAGEIAGLLSYTCAYMAEVELVRYRPPDWAERVAAYVEENLPRKIALADLARIAGRSASYVSHRFAQHFGCAPAEYVRTRRLGRAADLLKGDVKLAAVAAQLGFCDEFHLSKLFRKVYGRSPREYRAAGAPRLPPRSRARSRGDGDAAGTGDGAGRSAVSALRAQTPARAAAGRPARIR